MQRGLLGASVLVSLLSSNAAQAVTPDEVWQAWKDLAAGTGQTVTTTAETQQGDTLVVSGITFAMDMPDGSFSSSIDELRFRDMGDGRVEVTMSPAYNVTVNDTGSNTVVEAAITQEGLKLVAGGDATTQTYDFTAGSVSVATTGVTENGAALPVSVKVVLSAPGGTYAMARQAGDAMNLLTSLSAATLTVAVAANDGSSDMKLDATVQQFTASSGGTFGAMMDMEKVNEALAAGFAANFALGYGATTYALDVTDPSGPMSIRGKAGSGGLAFAMDKTAMTYKGGGKEIEVIASGAQIPFPEVALRYAESVFDFAVPLSKGDAPQPFNMTVKLIGATISDEVWGLFDPAGSLPRDPATLIVDANGTAKLAMDLTDEAATNSGQPPGTLESLNLPDLQLTAAGADLTGAGAFTFDNTDLTTFQGMPAPTGRIDLKLVGGNGLLDKLIQLGYVPEDQAMGLRMMLGMFARPGEGPDTLTSTIEFRDKGLFANGMQLQ
jgi:hypothetical protein